MLLNRKYCIFCGVKEKKKQIFSLIQYRYENDKIGEALVCGECEKLMEAADNE